ncbi:glycine betaine/L-proline ABC transporter permease ProW [Mangrovitalea sediminis]|uniref:glycine betaine/L-proline ABC transporter permease ProW n=1 Tax=Mangrovitalea sediminis TaxID=1982043 RepID=UPI000BE50AE4|nr:glycine betaine/L-proline ABC transporter permease ProW [Mangrovitalea sediminis]
MSDQAQNASSNPWGTPAASPAGADQAAGAAAQHAQAAPSWLSDIPKAQPHHFDWLHPFKETIIPLDSWVEHALNWVVLHFRPLFQAVRWPVDATLSGINDVLQWIPSPILIILLSLFAWQLAGRRLALGTFLSLATIGLIGAWSQALVTLSLVFTSVFFCIVIGLPLGIWLSRNDRGLALFRPFLDAMQTTPAFVYLVPIVMLFGIGNVPGVVVTIIFALPPLIRLTNLGIRQVPEDLVEAARSFGAGPKQLLFKVQVPLAMPTIMAGVNQTLMLALSMVVIASMIAVGGLGQMVLRGIGRLDMGLASVGGLGIVLLAIILDRMTQALGQDARSRPWRHWYEHGPVGWVRQLLGRG